MQGAKQKPKPIAWVLMALSVGIIILAWPILLSLISQVVWGYLLMALALPMAKRLESRWKPGPAASIALTALSVMLMLALALLLPLLFRQGEQLAQMLPYLIEKGEAALSVIKQWAQARDIPLAFGEMDLNGRLDAMMQAAFPIVLEKAGSIAGSLSALFPAPILAFYFLKDRESISGYAMMWVPLKHRAKAVVAAREMRREISCFLRGQMLISAAVGALTAVGLAIVGVPAWLLLGVLMGIFELIPYVGPIIAAVPVVMFALPGGIGKALWAVLVVIVVQQIESGFIAPRLMSGATNLHPVVVLLAISAGGIMGGVLGMLVALPIVVSLRGAFRVLRLKQA